MQAKQLTRCPPKGLRLIAPRCQELPTVLDCLLPAVVWHEA
jgi:hypothetical protein